MSQKGAKSEWEGKETISCCVCQLHKKSQVFIDIHNFLPLQVSKRASLNRKVISVSNVIVTLFFCCCWTTRCSNLNLMALYCSNSIHHLIASYCKNDNLIAIRCSFFGRRQALTKQIIKLNDYVMVAISLSILSELYVVMEK